MRFIYYSRQHFLEFLNIKDHLSPQYLFLVGSSEIQGNLCDLAISLHVGTKRKTGFPSVFLGKLGNLTIAYGISYATSLTADIVHAFCKIGVKQVFFVGNCGIVNSKKIIRGDCLIPWRVIDGTGIAAVYHGGKNTKLNKQRTNTDEICAKIVTCITWHNLFSENVRLVRKWQADNIDVVDLESAAIVSVCKKFSTKFQIYLVAADNLVKKEQLHAIYKGHGRQINDIRREIINAIRRRILSSLK